MLSLFFLVIGIIIILFALLFIKNQEKENDFYETSNENSRDLALSLEAIENIIDDISVTFNNTIEQMEKKYRVLESKIEQVEIKSLENQSNELNENTIQYTDYGKNKNYIDIDNNEIKQKENNEENEDYDRKIEKVKKLKNKGMSIPEIARALNIGIGEVRLIINLGKK